MEITMSSIYEMFETDGHLEQTGIWIDYGKHGKILIARAGGRNTKFAKIVDVKTRPYRRQIDQGTVDQQVADRLAAESFAEGVVLGWEGIKDKEGNDIPFTVGNVVKLLTDLPDLFSDLREQALQASNFRELEVEEAVGN
jgi:hypothetical protein